MRKEVFVPFAYSCHQFRTRMAGKMRVVWQPIHGFLRIRGSQVTIGYAAPLPPQPWGELGLLASLTSDLLRCSSLFNRP